MAANQVQGCCLANFGSFKIPSFLKEGSSVLSIKPTSGLLDLLSRCESLPPGEAAFVMSFLGTATVGKSTIARILLNLPPEYSDEDLKSHGGPRVLREVTAGPTTAGCWHYSSSLRPNLHILDMEGMEGCDSQPNDESLVQRPTVSQRPILESLTSKLPPGAESTANMTEKAIGKLRAASTKEHLPRLAYISSDIMFFVTQSNVWADRRIAKAVQKAADYAAPQGIRLSNKPHCVIIWNKASQKIAPGQDDTELFFEKHKKSKSLLQFYESVHVVRLHDWGRDQTEFEKNAQELRELMDGLLHQRREVRGANATLYNSLYWARLFASAIQRFHTEAELRFDKLLLEAIAADQSPHVQAALRFFDELSQSHDYYEQLAFAACRFYICLTRESLFRHGEKDPGATFHPKTLEQFAQKEREGLDQLIRHLNQLAPCDPPCILSRAEHGHYHQMAQMKGFSGFLRRIGRPIGLSKSDKKGAFSGIDLPVQSIHHEIDRITVILDRYKTSHVTFLCRAEQLKVIVKLSKPVIPVQFCMICMEAPEISSGCHHQYCRQCFAAITRPPNRWCESDHYKPFLGLGDNVMDARFCPMCGHSHFILLVINPDRNGVILHEPAEERVLHVKLDETTKDWWAQRELTPKLSYNFNPEDVLPCSSDEVSPSSTAMSTQTPRGNAMALYDFTGDQPGDLSFLEGDPLEITAKPGNWWTATNLRTGESGSFPSNFCQEIDPHS